MSEHIQPTYIHTPRMCIHIYTSFRGIGVPGYSKNTHTLIFTHTYNTYPHTQDNIAPHTTLYDHEIQRMAKLNRERHTGKHFKC